MNSLAEIEVLVAMEILRINWVILMVRGDFN